MFFETLESRQLYSVSLANGLLTVTGTNLNDAITVTKNASGQLSVNDDGVVQNFNYASVNQISINTLNGNDSVNSQDSMTKPMHIQCGTGSTTIHGGGGNDVINGGSGATNYLYGGAGDDVIYAYGSSTGQNYIEGDAGNDYINSYASGALWAFGNDGNDSIIGGSGWNDLHGGNGDDVISANFTTQRSQMYGDAGNDSITGAAGDNTLVGGDGNDLIRGGGGQNWINGQAGDDRLYGGYGPSTVYGGDGNDSLFGGQSNDYLSGDAGDDTIVSIGGGTADRLHGGGGFNSYWCDATETPDDETFAEYINGALHQVNRFSNGASTQLLGQNLTDPTDSGTTQNFKSDPLFSSTGPSPDDINQGNVGDCYFLGALSATAKVDPTRIKESVVDLGDGTYAVQFWWNGTPQFVRVDADLPTDGHGYLIYDKLGQQNSLWGPIMEKAFAYYRTLANTYASTNSGTSEEVFHDLNSAGVTTSSSWTSSLALLNYIQGELSAGKAVTASTPVTFASPCPCVSDHLYMVDHVNYITVRLGMSGVLARIAVSVTLRNPWGNNYGVAGATDPASAYVTISAAQAFANFTRISSAFI